MVKDVKDGKGTVGRLFSDEALYNNLNATVREVEDVMRQVRSGGTVSGTHLTHHVFDFTYRRIEIVIERLIAEQPAHRALAILHVFHHRTELLDRKSVV